MANTSCG